MNEKASKLHGHLRLLGESIESKAVQIDKALTDLQKFFVQDALIEEIESIKILINSIKIIGVDMQVNNPAEILNVSDVCVDHEGDILDFSQMPPTAYPINYPINDL